MFRIPYEILSINVDKLYPPHYTLKDGETIEQHLMDIEAFIEACGWTVPEYIKEYIHQGVKDLLPNRRSN